MNHERPQTCAPNIICVWVCHSKSFWWCTRACVCVHVVNHTYPLNIDNTHSVAVWMNREYTLKQQKINSIHAESQCSAHFFPWVCMWVRESVNMTIKKRMRMRVKIKLWMTFYVDSVFIVDIVYFWIHTLTQRIQYTHTVNIWMLDINSRKKVNVAKS